MEFTEYSQEEGPKDQRTGIERRGSRKREKGSLFSSPNRPRDWASVSQAPPVNSPGFTFPATKKGHMISVLLRRPGGLEAFFFF